MRVLLISVFLVLFVASVAHCDKQEVWQTLCKDAPFVDLEKLTDEQRQSINEVYELRSSNNIPTIQRINFDCDAIKKKKENGDVKND